MKRPHHITFFSSLHEERSWLLAMAFVSYFLAGCQKESPDSHSSFTIVAAENYYGDVAREIAGDSATIINILTNPNQDPHEFTADAHTAKAVSDANIVIYNGLGYDEWMAKLVAAQSKPGRIVIRVSDLTGTEPGDNPHICYDPRTIPALASKLSELLKKPNNLAQFQKEMDSVNAKIAEIKSKYAGTNITATEPVFNDMASALGFRMQNAIFQLAVMNGTEPSAQATAAFEQSLRSHTVKLLVYNSQVTNPASDRMRSIAKESGIPVVGITETEPPDQNYSDWMLSELNTIEYALETK